MVPKRRLELPRLAALDPKSVFRVFFCKQLQLKTNKYKFNSLVIKDT